MVALATVTGTMGATGVPAAKDITETSDNKIFTKRFILILQSSLVLGSRHCLWFVTRCLRWVAA